MPIGGQPRTRLLARLIEWLARDRGEFREAEISGFDNEALYFVSKNDDEITQFGSANQYGNIGLLAHNYLTGREFSRLSIGEGFHLVYSDGRQERYIVTEILRYRALDSKSPYSSFQNLADKDEVLTVSQMFDRAYQGGRHVTFQTCIAADGNSSWGRLFIIAIPIPENLGYGPSSP